MNRETDVAKDDTAAVIAPPPLILATLLAGGYALQLIAPVTFWLDGAVADARRVAGAIIILIAFAIVAKVAHRFRVAGTNIETYRPTTALVTDGLHRYSRNPVYFAFILVTIGIGFAAASAWMLAATLPLAVLLHYGVIAREERYLERRFGSVYLRYKQTVRRWL